MDLPQPLTASDIIAERCGVRPLAVKGDSGTADWLALSRKHAIDQNTQDAYLSIYGGKLTDCLNVGEEVAAALQDCGIDFPHLQQLLVWRAAGRRARRVFSPSRTDAARRNDRRAGLRAACLKDYGDATD